MLQKSIVGGSLTNRKCLWGAAFCAIGAVAASPQMALVILNAKSSPPGRMPDGWQLKVTRGAPDVALIEEPGGPVLRFKSLKSSFALERGVDVDVTQFPLLTWSWKVSELPRGGDFRSGSTDDQAAQVLVAFSDRRILSYIWDSSAPKGTRHRVSAVPFIHISALACRSGSEELNQWLPETHNLAEDFHKAFDRPPSRVKAIRLQINSQHTGTSAESYFGDISFRSARQ